MPVTLVYAASSPWTQSDWSGGSGQTNWSDTTKYSSSSNVKTSVANQVTLSSTEKFSNTGFESDLTGWDSGAYVVNDQFTTDRSGGAVNGSAAEPTGGNRVVVDTNNVLSITGGVLSFATGGLAAGDPGLWYSAITRDQGLTIIGSVTTPNPATNPMVFGFDSNQAGNIGSNGIQFTGGNIQAYEGASAKAIASSYTAGTTYQTAITLRSTGAYYFIKGGAYTNWTLIWSSALQSNTPVYPAVNVRVNPNIFSVDNMRVPFAFWLPTPLAFDSFASAGASSSETTGPDSQTTSSLSWTDQIGTWSASGGTAAATALTGGIAARTLNPSTANVLIDTAVTRSLGNAGLVFRYQDSSNYLIAYHDGTNVKVDKVVAGVTTNVISGTGTYSAGATLRIITDGTLINLFYNGSRIGASTGATVTDFSTATIHGLYTTNTGNTFDNFTVWPRSGISVPDTDLTATRDTNTKQSGLASAKLVAPSGNDANFTQSLNLGDTNSYNLSTYAYTDGSAVTSSDLSLYSATGVVATTFTSVGSGWYLLSGTATGAITSKPYGVQVKAGKTVYIDNFSLTNYPSSGTLTSSIFDRGGLGRWGTLTFSATTPSNTGLSLKIRGSNNTDLSDAPDFSACSTISSGSDISDNSCMSDDYRYLQYQITETSATNLVTPTFTNFSLAFDFIDSPNPVLPPAISTTEAPGCSAAVGLRSPDLFEIRTQKNSATLYFAPGSAPYSSIYIAYSNLPDVWKYGVEYPQDFSSGVLNYTINFLQPRIKYYFKIRSGNGCAVGGWSNTMSARTSSMDVRGVYFRNNLIQPQIPARLLTPFLPPINPVVTPVLTQNQPITTPSIKTKTKTCFLWWCF